MDSGIKGLKFVEKVTERDIDFLILEELQVNQSFREWISARVYEEPVFKAHVGAWHSVVDSEFGESDLVFIFDSEDGSTKGILIENKISADAQPDQGKRYQSRKEKGKSDGYWQECMTCLIAPRRYLMSTKQTETYDCQISYEEIMAFFAANRTTDSRQEYRAQMVLEGVSQHRRGYQPKTNEKITEFVTSYWILAKDAYPALRMIEPKPRAAGNTWVYFYPDGFPKSVDVVHQLAAGFVKVFFKGKALDFDSIEEKYRDLISIIPDLEIELKEKSVALSVPVEPIKPLEYSFESVKEKMLVALSTTEKLVYELRNRGVFS